MMTSRDNDIDKETLSESETSSNQDQGQGERCDRKGAGGGKPRTSNINKTDGVDSAAKKEGAPRKSHKRSGSNRNDNNTLLRLFLGQIAEVQNVRNVCLFHIHIVIKFKGSIIVSPLWFEADLLALVCSVGLVCLT